MSTLEASFAGHFLGSTKPLKGVFRARLPSERTIQRVGWVVLVRALEVAGGERPISPMRVQDAMKPQRAPGDGSGPAMGSCVSARAGKKLS